MAMRIEFTGQADEVLSDLLRIRDFNAQKLPAPCQVVGCEEHAGIDEQLAKTREDLAKKTLDMDAARIDIADAKVQLATSEETISSLRSTIEGLEGQLDVDARVIEGLYERLKNSPAVSSSEVRPPVPKEIGTVGDVSPALSGQEAEHGRAEAEHRKSGALPESREPERPAQERAEGGGDHSAGADVRSPGVRAGREEVAGQPVRAEPDGTVLHAGRAVQRGPAAGPLELAAEGLTGKPALYWTRGPLPGGAGGIQVIGSTARIVDAVGNDLALLGDVHEEATSQLIATVKERLQIAPATWDVLRFFRIHGGPMDGDSCAFAGTSETAAQKAGAWAAEHGWTGTTFEEVSQTEANFEEKETTDQAAKNGLGQATSASGEPSATEKAAETTRAAESLTTGIGAPEHRPASRPPAQWARSADQNAIFHIWVYPDDAEAICGETTDADVFPLPEGQKPPVEEACLSCADLIGWTEPTEKSKLPKEEPRVQGELALPTDGNGHCAICEKPTRRAPVVDATDLRACFRPYIGKRLCFEHEMKIARAGAIEETQCEAPDCKLEGEHDPATGGWFCTRFHYSIEESVRREFHLAKHPELKVKAEKDLALKPKKSRRKKSAGEVTGG